MNYTAEDIEIDRKTDAELYKEFLNGNEEAFNNIIRKYRKPLISFIMRFIKNIEVAEDIAQDTFVYVLINKTEYDFKYSLKTYLYTIAKCRAINYLKRERKVVSYDEAYMREKEETYIDEDLIKEENKKEIYEAIGKLKKSYQIVIYLKDIEGLKYKEISRILNKTVPQLKMMTHRARKSLEKTMRKEVKKNVR